MASTAARHAHDCQCSSCQHCIIVETSQPPGPPLCDPCCGRGEPKAMTYEDYLAGHAPSLSDSDEDSTGSNLATQFPTHNDIYGPTIDDVFVKIYNLGRNTSPPSTHHQCVKKRCRCAVCHGACPQKESSTSSNKNEENYGDASCPAVDEQRGPNDTNDGTNGHPEGNEGANLLIKSNEGHGEQGTSNDKPNGTELIPENSCKNSPSGHGDGQGSYDKLGDDECDETTCGIGYDDNGPEDEWGVRDALGVSLDETLLALASQMTIWLSRKQKKKTSDGDDEDKYKQKNGGKDKVKGGSEDKDKDSGLDSVEDGDKNKSKDGDNDKSKDGNDDKSKDGDNYKCNDGDNDKCKDGNYRRLCSCTNQENPDAIRGSVLNLNTGPMDISLWLHNEFLELVQDIRDAENGPPTTVGPLAPNTIINRTKVLNKISDLVEEKHRLETTGPPDQVGQEQTHAPSHHKEAVIGSKGAIPKSGGSSRGPVENQSGSSIARHRSGASVSGSPRGPVENQSGSSTARHRSGGSVSGFDDENDRSTDHRGYATRRSKSPFIKKPKERSSLLQSREFPGIELDDQRTSQQQKAKKRFKKDSTSMAEESMREKENNELESDMTSRHRQSQIQSNRGKKDGDFLDIQGLSRQRQSGIQSSSRRRGGDNLDDQELSQQQLSRNQSNRRRKEGDNLDDQKLSRQRQAKVQSNTGRRDLDNLDEEELSRQRQARIQSNTGRRELDNLDEEELSRQRLARFQSNNERREGDNLDDHELSQLQQFRNQLNNRMRDGDNFDVQETSQQQQLVFQSNSGDIGGNNLDDHSPSQPGQYKHQSVNDEIGGKSTLEYQQLKNQSNSDKPGGRMPARHQPFNNKEMTVRSELCEEGPLGQQQLKIRSTEAKMENDDLENRKCLALQEFQNHAKKGKSSSIVEIPKVTTEMSNSVPRRGMFNKLTKKKPIAVDVQVNNTRTVYRSSNFSMNSYSDEYDIEDENKDENQAEKPYVDYYRPCMKPVVRSLQYKREVPHEPRKNDQQASQPLTRHEWEKDWFIEADLPIKTVETTFPSSQTIKIHGTCADETTDCTPHDENRMQKKMGHPSIVMLRNGIPIVPGGSLVQDSIKEPKFQVYNMMKAILKHGDSRTNKGVVQRQAIQCLPNCKGESGQSKPEGKKVASGEKVQRLESKEEARLDEQKNAGNVQRQCFENCSGVEMTQQSPPNRTVRGILWAVTRITVFEDDSKAFDVRRPTTKTPTGRIPPETYMYFMVPTGKRVTGGVIMRKGRGQHEQA